MEATMETTPLTEAVYYILLALTTPLHGYGILKQVETFSRGRVILAAGTLYGALSTLQARGLIEPLPGSPGERRKEYRITGEGLRALTLELNRLEELLENGRKILEETHDPHRI